MIRDCKKFLTKRWHESLTDNHTKIELQILKHKQIRNGEKPGSSWGWEWKSAG